MLSCGQRSLGIEGNFDLLLTFLRTCTQPSTVFLNRHYTSPFFSLGQWFSTRRQFCPQGTLDNIWRHFWLSPPEEGVLLASSGWGSGMLLNTPQCPGAPQTVIQPQCHRAKGRDPAWGESFAKLPKQKAPTRGFWIAEYMSKQFHESWK